MRESFVLLLFLLAAIPGIPTPTLLEFSCNEAWSAMVAQYFLLSLAISNDASHGAFGILPTVYPNNNSLSFFNQSGVRWTANLGSRYSPVFSMSHDGSFVAALTSNRTVQTFRGGDGSSLWTFSSESGSNWAYAMSPDGKYVAVLVGRLEQVSGPPYAVTRNLRLYLLGTVDGGTAWFYNFPPMTRNETSSEPISISDDSGKIAVLIGSTLFMFSYRNNQTLWTAPLQQTSLSNSSDFYFYGNTAVEMAGNGEYVLTVQGRDAWIFSGSTGKTTNYFSLSNRIAGPTPPDEYVSFSRDSSTIGLIDGGGHLMVIDRFTGAVLFEKSTIEQVQAGSSLISVTPTSVSLSGDGNTVAVGAYGRELFLFNRRGDEICRTGVGYPNIYDSTYVKVSDDAQYVLASSNDFVTLFAITPHLATWILVGGITTGIGVAFLIFVRWRRKLATYSQTTIRVKQDPPSRSAKSSQGSV